MSSIDLLVMFIGYVLHECFVWGVLFSVECFIESLGSYYFISTIAKKSPGIVLLFVQRNHGEGGMKGESSNCGPDLGPRLKSGGCLLPLSATKGSRGSALVTVLHCSKVGGTVR